MKLFTATQHLQSLTWNLPDDSIVLLPIFFTKRGNCKDTHSVDQSTCFQKRPSMRWPRYNLIKLKFRLFSVHIQHRSVEIRLLHLFSDRYWKAALSTGSQAPQPVCDSYETSHHHSSEVLFMSGKNTYMREKRSKKTTKDICKECMEKKTQKIVKRIMWVF